jgi:hypothetical protein
VDNLRGSLLTVALAAATATFSTTAESAAEGTFHQGVGPSQLTISTTAVSFSATVDSAYSTRNGNFQSGFDITDFTLFGVSQNATVIYGHESVYTDQGVTYPYPKITDTSKSGNNTFVSYADQWKLSGGPLAAGQYRFDVTGNGGEVYHGTYTISPVPEPSTYVMLLGGLTLLAFTAYRKAKKNGKDHLCFLKMPRMVILRHRF